MMREYGGRLKGQSGLRLTEFALKSVLLSPI